MFIERVVKTVLHLGDVGRSLAFLTPTVHIAMAFEAVTVVVAPLVLTEKSNDSIVALNLHRLLLIGSESLRKQPKTYREDPEAVDTHLSDFQ